MFPHLLGVERSGATKQLVQKDAQRPQIRSICVALVLDDLGCHVIGRAANGPGAPLRADVFSERKVRKLAVTINADQHVVWLEVSVNVALGVDSGDRQQRLSDVKPRVGGGQPTRAPGG